MDKTHKLFHGTIKHLSGVSSLHEDSSSRIFNLFWFSSFKSSFRTRIARFSVDFW